MNAISPRPSLLIVDDDPLIAGWLRAGSLAARAGEPYIDTALELAAGNLGEAANLLGIDRTTLHSRMEAPAKVKAQN